jgi:hypothetical protein
VNREHPVGVRQALAHTVDHHTVDRHSRRMGIERGAEEAELPVTRQCDELAQQRRPVVLSRC